MSKSTIVLIATWILIGLVGAFLGGYFWEKRNVGKVDNPNGGNTITNNVKSNDVVPSSNTSPLNSAPNDSNKIVTQPNGATPSTPASNGTDKTIVPLTQPK